MADQQKNFWTSLPGILTGIAAVITALTGLFLAVNGGKSVSQSKPVKQTEQVSTAAAGQDTATKTATEEVKVVKPYAVPVRAVQKVEKKPFPATGPLVDCDLFPTVNTVDSLMSWSNHYHQQISVAGSDLKRARAACNDTIDYRGMAHCKVQNDQVVRQALLETLILCRSVGVEWQDIQHSTFPTKE